MPRRDVKMGRLTARNAAIPVVEALEQRQMLSAALKGAHLEVLGTQGDDVVVVNVKGPRLVVDVNGERSVFPKGAVRRMTILTGRGDDRIKVSPKTKPIALTLKAGPGENILLGRVAPMAPKPKPQPNPEPQPQPEPEPEAQEPTGSGRGPVDEPAGEEVEVGREDSQHEGLEGGDGSETLDPGTSGPDEEPGTSGPDDDVEEQPPVQPPAPPEEEQDETGGSDEQPPAVDPPPAAQDDQTQEPPTQLPEDDPENDPADDADDPAVPDTTGGGLLGDGPHGGREDGDSPNDEPTDGSGQPLSGDLDDFFAPLTIDAGADLVDGAVRGTGVTLTARGGFWIDGPAMRYHWSVTSKPAGASDPVFAGNGGAARDVAVTFSQAGQYTVQVVVLDGNNSMVGSALLTILVAQVAASIQIAPGEARLLPNSTMQFSAEVRDQFGQAMSNAAVTWSVETGGIGSVDAGGLYRVGPAIGSAVVRAVAGAVSARANVTVSTTAPVKPAGDGGFKVFDATLYLNKPDLSTLGIQNIYIQGPGAFLGRIGGRDEELDWETPDEAATRWTARRAAASGQVLIINIEHFSLDVRKSPEAVVERDMAKLIQIVRWVRDERPEVRLGFYGLMPLRDYWTPVLFKMAQERISDPWFAARMPEYELRYRAWQAANDKLKPLAEVVDIIFPSLYTFYNNPSEWELYARGNIEEAARYGKPVMPFIWMQYHNSTELIGQSIDAEFWRLQLEVIRARAQGVVIWGGVDYSPTAPPKPAVWNEQEPWWGPTRSFMEALAGSR